MESTNHNDMISQIYSQFRQQLQQVENSHQQDHLTFQAQKADLQLAKTQFLNDKIAWETEIKMVRNISSEDDEIVQLNVSGVTEGFVVRKSLLCSVKNSALEAMFSGRHKLKTIDGKIFVDRDTDVFRMVISYLRNNQQYPKIEDQKLNKLFYMELEFWGLDTSWIIFEDLKVIFESEP